MATFEYRCVTPRGDVCSTFEVRRPIGTAAPTQPCPACGSAAARVFSAPALALAPRARVSAIDRAERSRTEPDVVGAPPPNPRARRAPIARNPALQRLPRP